MVMVMIMMMMMMVVVTELKDNVLLFRHIIFYLLTFIALQR